MQSLAWLHLLACLVVPASHAENPVPPAQTQPRTSLELRLETESGLKLLQLKRDAQGELHYTLEGDEGRRLTLSPDELAEHLMGPRQETGFFARLFNISSPIGFAWVAIGFLGQVLFTGRMLIQWLASERQKRSVVPVAFWWMSLLGATMLLVYFIWRRDAVGVMGQATGWFIYTRNLLLISRSKREGSIAS